MFLSLGSPNLKALNFLFKKYPVGTSEEHCTVDTFSPYSSQGITANFFSISSISGRPLQRGVVFESVVQAFVAVCTLAGEFGVYSFRCSRGCSSIALIAVIRMRPLCMFPVWKREFP